jgi:hypothetical protein
MTKIKSIKVVNFKALKEGEINLNGASAIITAGNNKGKSSLLNGLIQRFQGDNPDIAVTQGEEKGENVMQLTDGSTIGWKFTKKSETFFYTTPDDIKMTTGVLSKIGEKYFGTKFSIDKFVLSSKTEQTKMIKSLLGIDLDVLDAEYKVEFDKRTDANRELKRLQGLKKEKPLEVESPDIADLQKKKADLVTKNDSLKQQWKIANGVHQDDIVKFNNEQNHIEQINEYAKANYNKLLEIKPTILGDAIDFKKVDVIINNLSTAHPLKQITSIPEPKYYTLEEIDKNIEDAYGDKAKFDTYETDLKAYNDWVKEGKEAVKLVEKINLSLTEINDKRLAKIKGANLPPEFELTDDGLLYNGLPLDNSQISSSAKYICALKLGYLALGKIRSLHFDASFLDNNSLREVQEWAESKDLQLLIERPSLEGGEIKYEIIQEVE